MFNASGACFDLLLLLLIVVFCVGIPLQFIYSMYSTKCTYISVFAKLKSDRQLNRKKTSSQRRKGKGHHNTGEKKLTTTQHYSGRQIESRQNSRKSFITICIPTHCFNISFDVAVFLASFSVYLNLFIVVQLNFESYEKRGLITIHIDFFSIFNLFNAHLLAFLQCARAHNTRKSLIPNMFNV